MERLEKLIQHLVLRPNSTKFCYKIKRNSEDRLTELSYIIEKVKSEDDDESFWCNLPSVLTQWFVVLAIVAVELVSEDQPANQVYKSDEKFSNSIVTTKQLPLELDCFLYHWMHD